MLNLALIPVVGSLLLVALMIFVTSRRANRVAEVRAEVERERQQVIRADVRNDEQFVENLLSGLGMDRAVTHFVDERSKLLPGVNLVTRRIIPMATRQSRLCDRRDYD